MTSHEEKYLLRQLARLLRKDELPWQNWMDGFLDDLKRSNGVVSVAIDLSDKSRDTVYKYRRRNPEFARRWNAIIAGARGEPQAQRSARGEPGSQPRTARPCQSTAVAHRRQRRNLRKLLRRQ